MALRLRDLGEPLHAALVLLCSWTALALSAPSIARNARRDPINRARYLGWSSALYAGGEGRANPLLSPLYGDFSRLPPLFIQAAGRDAPLDDSTRLAERARGMGVSVTLDVWPAPFHDFQMSARLLPEGRRAIERAGTLMRAAVGSVSSA